MRRHVIRSFVDVGVHRVIHLYQAIHPLFQIMTCCMIGIFLDQQTCGCMLYKYRADPVVCSRILDHALDLLRDLV